jgi:hypothetical protein
MFILAPVYQPNESVKRDPPTVKRFKIVVVKAHRFVFVYSTAVALPWR